MGDLFTISFVEGEVGVTLSTNFRYFTLDFPFTIVGVTVSPSADDADATIDINDDGTGVITAVDASDADVPGTWKSTHLGGAQTPVAVAAGSKVSFDANSAASGTRFGIVMTCLLGAKNA